MSDLLTELRGGASVATTGHLTLDREKAREKLRKFRLVDPHYYVLQFVRAASVLGASKIRFRVGVREMECEFDAELPRGALESLWERAFDARESEADIAVHYIALGVGSAQALNPAWIEIESGGAQLVIRGEDEEVTHVTEVGEGKTRITMREKFSLGHLKEFYESLGGRAPEEVALEHHCRFTEVIVEVNGRQISVTDDGHQFQTAAGIVRIGAPEAEEMSIAWFHLLRDDVWVGTQHLDLHVVPAVGVLHSPLVKTDLSGLVRVEDDENSEKLRENLVEAYHRYILDTQVGSLSEAAKVALLYQVSEFANWRRSKGEVIPDSTRSLIARLAEEPLFELADATSSASGKREKRSIDDLTCYGAVRFSSGSFLEDTLINEEVALLDTGSEKKRHALESACRWLGREIVDVTDEVKQALRRSRNRDRWLAQDPRQPPDSPFQVVLRDGSLEGAVYLPVDSNGFHLDRKRMGLRVHVQGRLLRHHPDALAFPMTIDLDGDFTVVPDYSDIVMDERAEALVASLVREVPGMLKLAAADRIKRGNPGLDAVFDRWAYETALGHSPEQIVRQPPSPTRQPGDRAIHSVEDLLTKLGPIADVPSYHLSTLSKQAGGRFWTSRRTSLREILEMEGPISVVQESSENSVEFMARLKARVEEVPSLLVADPVQAGIVRLVRADLTEARAILGSVLAKAGFLERPIQRGSPRDLYPLAHRSETLDGLAIDVAMYDPARGNFESFSCGLHTSRAERSGCRVDVLYEGRLIDVLHVDVLIGRFRAQVSGESVVPNRSYDRVKDTTVIEETLKDICDEMIRDWWESCVRRGALEDPAHRSLFIEMSLRILSDGGHFDEPTIPVLVLKPNGSFDFEEKLVSVNRLKEQAREIAGVVPFVRGGTPSPEMLPSPTAMVVQCDVDGGEVSLAKFFPEEKVTDLAVSRTGTVRDSFLAKPTVGFFIPGAGPLAFETGGDIEVKVRIAPELREFGGPPVIRTQVLHENRSLEEIDLPAPLSSFLAIGRGRPIGPDVWHRHVGAGREKLRQVVLTAVNELVKKLCRRLRLLDSEGSIGEMLYDNSRDRDELSRRIILDFIEALGTSGSRRVELEEQGLLDELESTPLFETTSGALLKLDELDTIAVDGVIICSDGGRSGRVLRVLPKHLHIFRRALGDRWVLEFEKTAWAARPDRPTDDRPAGGPDDTAELAPVESSRAEEATRSGEEQSGRERVSLLDSVTTRMLEIRGDRVDLLDDALARDLSWVGIERDEFCSVSSSGVRITWSHPLAERLRERHGEATLLFVTSVVYSSINRYYTTITDSDEVEFQRRFLAAARSHPMENE